MTDRPARDDRAQENPNDAAERAVGGSHRPDLDGAVEVLVRYDQASEEELAALEADPVTAAILGRLRAVDQFLVTGGLARANGRSTEAFPLETFEDRGSVTPDELYAHGGGPDPLPVGRGTGEIESHLAQNPDEHEWVSSLRTNPPNGIPIGRPVHPKRTGEAPPLEWTGLDMIRDMTGDGADDWGGDDGDDERPEGRGPRPFPTWVAWTPLAAAALVLAMSLSTIVGPGDRGAGLPESPVTRSARTTSLLFPRGRVLEAPPTGASFASAPRFEVTPVREAKSYRYEVRATGEGPFDEGEVVWSLTSTEHTVSAPPFVPGDYEWSAWATIDGLEVPLGDLVMQVVDRDEVTPSLALRANVEHEDDVRADVRALHSAGFLTDARQRALELPPSRERDRYLGLE